mmetsp:Transcript_51469/g.129134  ORF Transcript_51469/g.129134 Transcript_51469/m.129134 type:complete len:240 (-) Transcript_51469:1029-1748(-)
MSCGGRPEAAAMESERPGWTRTPRRRAVAYHSTAAIGGDLTRADRTRRHASSGSCGRVHHRASANAGTQVRTHRKLAARARQHRIAAADRHVTEGCQYRIATAGRHAAEGCRHRSEVHPRARKPSAPNYHTRSATAASDGVHCDLRRDRCGRCAELRASVGALRPSIPPSLGMSVNGTDRGIAAVAPHCRPSRCLAHQHRASASGAGDRDYALRRNLDRRRGRSTPAEENSSKAGSLPG